MFDGQAIDLRFHTQGFESGQEELFIDDVVLNVAFVPEPTTMPSLVAALIVLSRRRAPVSGTRLMD